MPLFQYLKRRWLLRKSFPELWLRTLENEVPYYQNLPDHYREILKKRMVVFINEKLFEGCGGLEITEQMKVIISAYACIPLMEETSDYYPDLRSILVYRNDYVAPVFEVSPGGVVTEGNERRQGESWDSGSVIFSWADIERTTMSDDNIQNLIVHEFAHQLDLQYGLSGGITHDGEVLNSGDEWTDELAKIYRKLVYLARNGREDELLDIYGATNPSECFAVIMEAFIESPRDLSIQYSRIYRMLSEFFKIDPDRW